MKKRAIIAAFVTFSTAPLFALAGIGGHWAPTFGTEMSGATQNIKMSTPGGSIDGSFVREKATIENGFGFKAWFELPFLPINFEATTNFQGSSYGASLDYTDPISGKDLSIPLDFDMGFPLLGKTEPLFGLMRVDLSAAWRAFDVSLLVLGLQGYVGGGVTWSNATRPLTAEVAQDAVEALLSSSLDPSESTKALQNALENAYGDPDSGFGGHALIGVRAKVLFFSLYANGKYYFGGLPKGIDSGLTLELGGGFGI